MIALSVGAAFYATHERPYVHAAHWVKYWTIWGAIDELKRTKKRLCIWGSAEDIKKGYARDLIVAEADKYKGVSQSQVEV